MDELTTKSAKIHFQQILIKLHYLFTTLCLEYIQEGMGWSTIKWNNVYSCQFALLTWLIQPIQTQMGFEEPSKCAVCRCKNKLWKCKKNFQYNVEFISKLSTIWALFIQSNLQQDHSNFYLEKMINLHPYF